MHQYVTGNVGGNDATVDCMHDLYVWIACSAGFVLSMSEGVYCCLLCWLVMKSSTSLDVSLSIFCNCVLNHLLSKYAYTSL